MFGGSEGLVRAHLGRGRRQAAGERQDVQRACARARTGRAWGALCLDRCWWAPPLSVRAAAFVSQNCAVGGRHPSHDHRLLNLHVGPSCGRSSPVALALSEVVGVVCQSGGPADFDQQRTDIDRIRARTPAKLSQHGVHPGDVDSDWVGLDQMQAAFPRNATVVLGLGHRSFFESRCRRRGNDSIYVLISTFHDVDPMVRSVGSDGMGTRAPAQSKSAGDPEDQTRVSWRATCSSYPIGLLVSSSSPAFTLIIISKDG